MSDNDIKKALECCRDCKCKECPCYNKESNGCKEIDEQDILDLINRQQAEIERLKEKVNKNGLVCQITIDDEKLEDIKNSCLDQIEYNIKEIQSKAIKEFAERLKRNHIAKDNNGKVHLLVEYDEFDNLVKEMSEQ